MATISFSGWLNQISEFSKKRSSKHIYQYRPLEQNQIRLLRLSPPAAGTQSIECELIHVSLSDRITYEALSYVWGAPVLAQTINVKCQGPSHESQTKVLPITDSLYIALRSLRYKTESRNLWVDQLSINQNDTSERNSQVACMGEIYSKATCAVVWLGPRSNDAYLLEDMYKTLSRVTSNAANSDNMLMLDQKALARIIGTSYSDEKFDDLIRRRRRLLENMLDLPWFCRAWVYQEAVVAPTVEIVWGDLILPLNFVTGLMVSMYGIAKSAEEGRWHRRIKNTKGFAPVRTIYHDREAHLKGELNFLNVLWHARKSLDAYNPRDYVYAFRSVNKHFNSSRKPTQSVADPLQDMIKIRYQDSVEDVFSDLALAAISSSSSLDILQYVVPTKPSHPPSCLPSWVPNWQNRHFVCGSPIFVPGVPNASSACGEKKHKMTENSGRRQLYASGHTIGRVEAIMKHSFKHTYYSPTLREALRLEEIETLLSTGVKMIAHGHTPRWFLDSPRETLLQTIIADGSFTTSNSIIYPLKDLLRAYDNESDAQSKPAEDTDGEAESKLRHYLRQTSEMASGKRVFLTNGVDIGLGFSTIRKGDLVCILYGCKMPCVLRKAGISEDQYVFVGLCYLHGWMDGNTSPSNSKWHDQKLKSFMLV